MEAIAYCHKMKIIHKDLKGANIMFSEPVVNFNPATVHVKIVDLGLAEIFTPSSTLLACGTPVFMAPEVWMSVVGQGTFGAKCDVYSMGSLLWIMVSCGQEPYRPKVP